MHGDSGGGEMAAAVICGHPTPSGPCTRKVLPGAGGCGFHPAPADPSEERHPVPAPTCQCERPFVGARPDNGDPPRCWWCARPVATLLAAEGGPGKVTDEPTWNDLIKGWRATPPEPTKEPTEDADPGEDPPQEEEPPAEEPTTFNELLHRRGR
jgi:hypothetical protein